MACKVRWSLSGSSGLSNSDVVCRQPTRIMWLDVCIAGADDEQFKEEKAVIVKEISTLEADR